MRTIAHQAGLSLPVAVLVALSAGCSGSGPGTGQKPGAESTGTALRAAAGAAEKGQAPPKGTGDTGPKTATEVHLRSVKLSAFQDTIKSLKGRVVVVDFWADY